MLRFLIIFSLLFSLNSCKERDKIQVQKISFYSKEGRQRVKESKYSNDFFQLVNFYQPQINPLYCGIATSVILLNAFKADDKIPSQKEAEFKKPDIFGGGVIKFNSYLQSNFLNKNTNKIKDKEVIELGSKTLNPDGTESYDPGLTLENLDYILSQIHKLRVKRVYAEENDEKSVKEFRKYLKKYLSDEEHFMVVNFYGKKIKNETGGHISPLAAYHEESDSVLVLDVALHKDKWYFVGVEDLYNAMHSKDGDNYRGYLIVSE